VDPRSLQTALQPTVHRYGNACASARCSAEIDGRIGRGSGYLMQGIAGRRQPAADDVDVVY
jgi:hypothetical protein